MTVWFDSPERVALRGLEFDPERGVEPRLGSNSTQRIVLVALPHSRPTVHEESGPADDRIWRVAPPWWVA